MDADIANLTSLERALDLADISLAILHETLEGQPDHAPYAGLSVAVEGIRQEIAATVDRIYGVD